MFIIPKIQSAELKKVNKLKSTIEDTSVPLGREKISIISREDGAHLGGKEERDRGSQGRSKPDLLLGEEKGLKP